MATRNRIIYQSVALYSSPITGILGSDNSVDGHIPSGSVSQLQRVTDINWGGEVTRQDINVMGQLANLSREIIEEPVVNLDFTYFLADGLNELSGLGLSASDAGTTNLISNILQEEGASAERNFYVLTVPEGVDANDTIPTGSDKGVIGIGNAFLTNYSVNLAVGDIPTANVSFECANLLFQIPDGTGITGNPVADEIAATPKMNEDGGTGFFDNPAIKRTGVLPNIAATGKVCLPTYETNTDIANVLRPGDIELSFGTADLSAGGAVLEGMTSASTKQSAHVQSVSIEVPLARTPINKLGNPFAFSRPLDVPINTTLTVSANVGDITTGSLVDLICNDDAGRDITISLKDKCSTGNNMQYIFKGAQLDSQSMSQAIGDNQTVDITFSAQIGGVNDQTNGVFLRLGGAGF